MPNIKDKNATVLLSLFFIFSLANLIALATATPSDNYLTKPLLMICLGAYAYLRQTSFSCSTSRYLLVGLFFSFLGDTLLLFADGRPAGGTFFLLGLCSFLLTHLAYWLAFHYWPDQQKGRLSIQPYWSMLFGLFWVSMLFLLWPGLPGSMQIPVLIYSLVIILMAAKALHITTNLGRKNAQMLVSGAILFVLSDSFIAFSRFTDLLNWGPFFTGLVIMITYLGGQLLIVSGVLGGLVDQRKNHST